MFQRSTKEIGINSVIKKPLVARAFFFLFLKAVYIEIYEAKEFANFTNQWDSPLGDFKTKNTYAHSQW